MSVPQPPQDQQAEQSVLGGMLLSATAVIEVTERLHSDDFYQPAHQNIYNAIVDMHTRGDPVDPVTAAAELDRRGQLHRVGGHLYLHTLISTVPTAVNAGSYAEIVAGKATLRRLTEVGTRITEYGYSGADGFDLAELLDRALNDIQVLVDGRAEPRTPAYTEHILTRSALLTLPDPEPLIDNVLDQGTTALLYGSWGTAKSFIALDWACSVATGHNWQGRNTEHRRSLYVAGEGAYGFKGRVQAWETGWRTKITDDELHILPRAVNLTHAVEIGNLCALIGWGGYDFIVVDTLARCMVGGDENSAKDCGIVVDAMTRMLTCTSGQRGVVLGVHHAGKDGKTLRGSSAFESGVDTVYFTAREDQVITLDREKRKDGPELDQHELKLALIEGSGSCVIESYGDETKSETNFRERELGLIWSQHFSETGCTSAQLRDVSGMSKATFYRALSDLLKSKQIENIGTSKRPFYVRPGNE